MSVCRSRVDEERGTCNIVTIFVRLCVGIIGYQAGIRMQSRTLLFTRRRAVLHCSRRAQP